MSRSEVYVNKHLNDALQVVADKKKSTKAAVLNDLLTGVGIGDESIKPIVLQIPVELLNNKQEQLQEWLSSRSSGIINHFYPKN